MARVAINGIQRALRGRWCGADVRSIARSPRDCENVLSVVNGDTIEARFDVIDPHIERTFHVE
jgi:hypothetical protein